MCSKASQRGVRHPRAGEWRGQNLVELALLMPFLALLLIGAIDLGRVFIAYTRLTSVVREGALYGGHFPADTTGIRNRAYSNVDGGLGTQDVDVVISATADIRCYQGQTTTLIVATIPGNCAAEDTNSNALVKPGDSIEVTGRYVFRPITSQLIRLLPANYQIKKSSRMVIQ